jgi:hypothetical protein
METKMAKAASENAADPESAEGRLQVAVDMADKAIKEIDLSKISSSAKAKFRERIRGLLDSWDEK